MEKKARIGLIAGGSALGLVLIVLLLYVFPRLEVKEPEPTVPVQMTVDSYVSNRSRVISDYESRLRKQELTLDQQVGLAQLYLAEARATRNEALLVPKAQLMLEEILDEEPNHQHGRAVYASLNNVLHRFEEAEAIARELVMEGSLSPFVFGAWIDALVELGRYEDAVEITDQLLSIRPGIGAYSRAAYLRELHGDGEGAKNAMALAAEAGVTGHEDRSWALYQLAQLYLAENELDTAEKIYAGILEEAPNYALAYGGLAWIALLKEDYQGALYLFDAAYGRLPDDRFLEGKAEVYLLLGEEEQAIFMQQRILESLKEARSFGENVDMEQADFLLDMEQELKQALEWAESEYRRRPGHLHALETYAWALHKNGRSAEAIPFIEKAMRLETGDAMVYYRAGKVYEGAGDQVLAGEYLKKSLAANIHIESPSTAIEIAQLLE